MLENLRDIIKLRSGKFVMVDTRWTIDQGWETMVFSCDEDGKVKNWSDLDCARYANKEDAAIGHAEIINKWIKS